MKTIRVRIAVAINEKGEWSSSGWSNRFNEEELVGYCLDVIEDGTIHWIEADVPVPGEVIEGEVK